MKHEAPAPVDVLRHFLAALAYRLDKVLVNAPANFGEYDAGGGVRTPAAILAHMGDVLIWGTGRITGEERRPHSPGTWDEEIVRFEAVVGAFDRALAGWTNPDGEVVLKLLQGPLADAMTHVGQLAMLSRLAGHPIGAENFYDAPIGALPTEDEETR